ncbi:MAG: hypothetical protein GY856_55410, partial [bacterium]|nr:hypothetical protein [bacterium]
SRRTNRSSRTRKIVFTDLTLSGGTSLLAIHLVAEILFEAPSVELLTQALRRGGEQAQYSPLVVMQPGSLEPPFFCIHPGGGSVLSYARLTRHLDAEQPFYAIQARGVHGEAEPLETVEEMAASYLPVIRKAQPRGRI